MINTVIASNEKLLAELDQQHDTPNDLRVKKRCERARVECAETRYIRKHRGNSGSPLSLPSAKNLQQNEVSPVRPDE